MQFNSQDGQDQFLEINLFKGFKNGIFVDVGAHDGISINNTLFFEQNHNWTGINIEPILDVYSKLVLNRPNCINLNCAVNDVDGPVEFILNKGYSEMISGIKSHFDNRHLTRLKNECETRGSISEVIKLDALRLETILDLNNIKHINYLSIDVEGAEFAVIKSVNFDKVFIDVIGFENNFDDVSVPIIDYLISKGYIRCNHNCIDIFMVHNKSQFA